MNPYTFTKLMGKIAAAAAVAWGLYAFDLGSGCIAVLGIGWYFFCREKQQGYQLALGCLLAIAPASVGVTALMSLYIPKLNNLNIGGVEHVDARTALLLVLTGFASIIYALIRLGQRPQDAYRQWPTAAATGLAFTFIVIWQFQLSDEKVLDEAKVAVEANRIKMEIAVTLNQTSLALQRFASRVEYIGTKDEGFLKLDAKNYLSQLPMLKRIGLIDTQNKVFWSYPVEIAQEVQGFDQSQVRDRFSVLEEARLRRVPSMSRSVELRSGGTGFFLPVALFPKQKFSGYIYATIEAQKIFQSFTASPNFEVRVMEQGRSIFEVKASSPLITNFSTASELAWGQSKWRIVVTPTKDFIVNGRSNLPTYTLVFGLMLSLIFGAYLQRITLTRKATMAAAAELSVTSERLRRVIEATGEGIWEREYVAGGQITFIDQQAKRIFGIDGPTPIYQIVIKAVIPEDQDKLRNAVAEHVEKQTPGFDVEFRMNPHNDENKVIWVNARGKVVAVPGAIPQLISTVKDVTVEVEKREQLKRALVDAQDATKAKSEFLANMSHEIRTPLNGVIGMTGLLLDTHLDVIQKEYAETVRSSAEILLGLVNDILDFSKIEARKLDFENIDFSFGQVVHNIEKLVEFSLKQKKLSFSSEIDPAFLTVSFRGDPNRIGQVLANLIGNAIKFTETGSISLKVNDEPLGVPVGGTLVKKIRVAVTDTGIGMSDAARSKMFQVFSQADNSTTRRFGGTGLGLSICKHLVEMMGGEIGVTSIEKVGSTFWFTLVLPFGTMAPQLAATSLPFSDITTQKNKIRILLAEDNKVNQMIAIKMLERGGFRIDAVANGREAVTAVQNIPYDLVLMDCQMPELDGYAATTEIRKLAGQVAQIPIIAMTANAMIGDRERCIAAGMDDYVVKPMKAQFLIDTIHRVLAEKIAA